MRYIQALSAVAVLAAAAACSPDAAEAPAAEPSAVAESGDGQPAAAAATSAILDPNSATAEQLAAAPGMTAELAAAVVAGRPYAGAAAFDAQLRKTLSEAEAAKVREAVFVPVDLNSASREDIALIPGMSEKMIHEFEEYRPYADMAEFDREIGKYVDAAEVARLRRYVTL